MFKKLILVALLTLAPLPVFAQQNRTVSLFGGSQQLESVDEEQLPLAKNLAIRQKRVFSEIDARHNYTPFSIELLSSFRTKIKIKWDDENITFRGKEKESYTLKENTGRGFTFLAFQPTKGFFTITDEADNVLMEIPYTIQNKSHVSQRVGVSTSASTTDFNPRVSLRYSRTVRGLYADEGNWNFNTSVSTDLDNLEDIRINLGVGYSW